MEKAVRTTTNNPNESLAFSLTPCDIHCELGKITPYATIYIHIFLINTFEALSFVAHTLTCIFALLLITSVNVQGEDGFTFRCAIKLDVLLFMKHVNHLTKLNQGSLN